MQPSDFALDRGAGKIRRLGAQAGERVEQCGFAGVGIADERERERVVVRRRVEGRSRRFVSRAHAPSFSRMAQWPGWQTSTRTRMANSAEIPSREPKIFRMSGLPARTSSTRRPTQTPRV